VKDWEREVLEVQLLGSDTSGPCSSCDHVGDLIACGSRRMDCDLECNLCVLCAKEYHEDWDAMWQDYYSSRF
jgi:hypothetical protein